MDILLSKTFFSCFPAEFILMQIIFKEKHVTLLIKISRFYPRQNMAQPQISVIVWGCFRVDPTKFEKYLENRSVKMGFFVSYF